LLLTLLVSSFHGVLTWMIILKRNRAFCS
jgi:hypothetical protein